MSKEDCKGNCCEHFFDDYNEDEDDYEIQRLKDIIKICEFLIQTKEHNKHKKEHLEDILKEATKKTKDKKSYTTTIPQRVWYYRYPKYWDHPWWNEVWF